MISLLQHAYENKASALALHLVARECLVRTSIEIGSSTLETCNSCDASRQQVYVEKKRIEAALNGAILAGSGRPRQGAAAVPLDSSNGDAASELKISALEYRLANPGALVVHASGRTAYSDSFKRFILDQSDSFAGRDEAFCRATSVPYTTLTSWRQLDAKGEITSTPPPERTIVWPTGFTPNELACTIAFEYKRWSGKLRDFLRYAAKHYSIAPSATRNVLRIAGMLTVDSAKAPRYRGSTLHASPGTIAVTDGKEVSILLSSDGELHHVNWQGIVDQATACHLAVVMSKEEDAAAVGKAYTEACAFLGKPPLALVHDQKPIHKDSALHATIEPATSMVPATLGRPENKAVIEGEFGKFERDVGQIVLDNTSVDSLILSAAREVVRAYTSGINHAARAELDGKSRAEVVREACPDPAKDKAIVSSLKAGHQYGSHKAAPLPTEGAARTLLDEAFARLFLTALDPTGRLKAWLAATFEPAAIRHALAIFEAKRAKGSLRGKEAHRYLVKLIREAQIEKDLEREEILLLQYAETERRSLLGTLEQAKTAIEQTSTDATARIIAFAEHAIFGGIFLEKAFWEQELIAALDQEPSLFNRVTTHLRRLYEAPPLCRRRLLNRLVASHFGLVQKNS